MCNLSQGIVDRTIINVIINIQKNTGWPEERCMDTMGIPEEHRKLYHMMLQDKQAVSQI